MLVLVVQQSDSDMYTHTHTHTHTHTPTHTYFLYIFNIHDYDHGIQSHHFIENKRGKSRGSDPILSSQIPLCLSVSHSLFLLAPSPCLTSAPPCSLRRWCSSLCSHLLLRPRVHQDQAREPNCLPACRWRESDFQHDQADDRVDRLGQGNNRAWVGVVDCWGDL